MSDEEHRKHHKKEGSLDSGKDSDDGKVKNTYPLDASDEGHQNARATAEQKSPPFSPDVAHTSRRTTLTGEDNLEADHTENNDQNLPAVEPEASHASLLQRALATLSQKFGSAAVHDEDQSDGLNAEELFSDDGDNDFQLADTDEFDDDILETYAIPPNLSVADLAKTDSERLDALSRRLKVRRTVEGSRATLRTLLFDEEDEIDRNILNPFLLMQQKDTETAKKLHIMYRKFINQAEINFALSMDEARLKGAAVFIFTAVIALLTALIIYNCNHDYGPPPSYSMAMSADLLPAWLIGSACLCLSAVVVLYMKVSALWVGFVWMLMLMLLIFGVCRTLGTSITFIIEGDFTTVLSYASAFYEENLKVPAYFAYYERTGNCCGWGEPDQKYRTWPRVLKKNHLSDSCCTEFTFGCGTNAIFRNLPSGFIHHFNEAEFQAFKKANHTNYDDELWANEESDLSYLINIFHPKNGVPGLILRWIDEIKNSESYYYLGHNNHSAYGPIHYVYHTFGVAEKERLLGTVFPNPCNPDEILRGAKLHALLIAICAGIQFPLCIMMFTVFWYYYVEIQANHLAKEREPAILKVLKMERICVDDGFNNMLQGEAMAKRRSRKKRTAANLKKIRREREKMLKKMKVGQGV